MQLPPPTPGDALASPLSDDEVLAVMLCLAADESFDAYVAKYGPKVAPVHGPKIAGNSWAARQEQRLWRELNKGGA